MSYAQIIFYSVLGPLSPPPFTAIFFPDNQKKKKKTTHKLGLVHRAMRQKWVYILMHATAGIGHFFPMALN